MLGSENVEIHRQTTAAYLMNARLFGSTLRHLGIFCVSSIRNYYKTRIHPSSSGSLFAMYRDSSVKYLKQRKICLVNFGSFA